MFDSEYLPNYYSLTSYKGIRWFGKFYTGNLAFCIGSYPNPSGQDDQEQLNILFVEALATGEATLLPIAHGYGFDLKASWVSKVFPITKVVTHWLERKS